MGCSQQIEYSPSFENNLDMFELQYFLVGSLALVMVSLLMFGVYLARPIKSKG